MIVDPSDGRVDDVVGGMQVTAPLARQPQVAAVDQFGNRVSDFIFPRQACTIWYVVQAMGRNNILHF